MPVQTKELVLCGDFPLCSLKKRLKRKLNEHGMPKFANKAITLKYLSVLTILVSTVRDFIRKLPKQTSHFPLQNHLRHSFSLNHRANEET